jgi:hypothetical protein
MCVHVKRHASIHVRVCVSLLLAACPLKLRSHWCMYACKREKKLCTRGSTIERECVCVSACVCACRAYCRCLFYRCLFYGNKSLMNVCMCIEVCVCVCMYLCTSPIVLQKTVTHTCVHDVHMHMRICGACSCACQPYVLSSSHPAIPVQSVIHVCIWVCVCVWKCMHSSTSSVFRLVVFSCKN